MMKAIAGRPEKPQARSLTNGPLAFHWKKRRPASLLCQGSPVAGCLALAGIRSTQPPLESSLKVLLSGIGFGEIVVLPRGVQSS